MMRLLTSAVVAMSLLAIAVPTAAQFQDVGSLEFPTSAGEEAQNHFLRGVAMLHSFGWKQAIEQFQRAQEIEPDFALAYWGESLCYNHPLIGERDLESPREVLARLAPTPEERAVKAPTARERGFLEAVEALFGEGSKGERVIAYMEKMEAQYERFPDDPEVRAFYALSLLAAVGPAGDTTFRLNVKAGALALELFEQNPDHPGAAHYTIHAFDDPVHAPLALAAAERFAEIAPAVSHARHMPTHIFIQHGMWDRVSESNQSAYEAAVDLWEPGDSVGNLVHSLDWGQYGDLQLGDLERARQWIERLERIVEDSRDEDGEPAARAVGTLPLVKARYAVETGDWGRFEIDNDRPAVAQFAIGMAALKGGDKAAAEQAATALERMGQRESDDTATFARGPKPAQIMHHELSALILLAAGKKDEARQTLSEAVAIAESMGPPRGSATPIKPAHELYGEVLLELGDAAEAQTQFERSLQRTRNRPLSLLGLARAQQAQGDTVGAHATYAALAGIAGAKESLAGLDEARRYLRRVPSADDQIAAAVLAAPEGRRKEAGVLGYSEAGRLMTLREVKNDLICLYDDPGDDLFSVACYHKDLEPFMARGRELSAQGVTGRERIETRLQEVDDGVLEMPREPRTLYVLHGSGFDAESGEVQDPYLRWVIYQPYATPESTGLSTTPAEGAPWLMDPGTAGAHVMITPPRSN